MSSNGDGARHLALLRAWLVTALLVATLFPAAAVLRALYLSVYFEATEDALYAARVGHQLGAIAAGSGIVLIALAIGIRWVAPPPSPTVTAGVTIAITALLGVTGAASVGADRSLSPFGPELQALWAFVPPQGARHEFDSRMASEHPVVQRFWRVPGSTREVCSRAVERVQAWVAPSTMSNVLPTQKNSCASIGRVPTASIRLVLGPRDQ